MQAPITQLQTAAGLLNPGGVVNTQTGQIVTGEGTEYTKTNGGLMNGLLGLASIALPMIGGPVAAAGGALAGKAASKGG